MAVLGSIRFKRTLKQFLDCDDLETVKAVALIEKLRRTSRGSLEHLIQMIPASSGAHRAILTEICLDNVEGSTEELFLKSLDHDATDIRATAAAILSQTDQVKPGKLFQKLHESDISKTEIIDILAFQREQLKPEQLITNALKLDKAHAEQLLKLAPDSKLPLDLEVLRIEPSSIESPSIKIMLLRYFAQVEQAAVAQHIARFLTDDNKTVVIEALKALKNLPVKFDASVLLPFIESMSEIEHEMAIDVLRVQADAELVPKFAPWTCSKSDETREIFIKLLVKHITSEGLESFLRLLEPAAQRLGFDEVHCNHLQVDAGKLTGNVHEPIVNADFKCRLLQQRAQTLELALSECCAIGDGANDLPMLMAAGLGIAYHAKPVLRAATSCHIDVTDLESAIYFMGLTPRLQGKQDIGADDIFRT